MSEGKPIQSSVGNIPRPMAEGKNVIITMGDPAGVGPEVALKALASPRVKGLANFLLIGDGFVIDRVRRDMGLKLKTELLDIANVPPKSFAYGKSHPAFGVASIEYVDRAMKLLSRKKADCLVTAPVNKSSIRLAGISDFEGHTEYLASGAGIKDYAMMFVGKRLKITLVTRHIALKQVPGRLSVEKISSAIALTHKYLNKYFRIDRPRIGVAGLNPHTGENGAFGDEEKRIIIPAIKRLSKDIRNLYGPIPPDVIFYDGLNGKFDACIAMYHDQGLIPFKLLYFKNGVNLTLGLPFIRTSPDHGTAFDIAGKGIADPGSMIEAILLAIRCSQGRS